MDDESLMSSSSNYEKKPIYAASIDDLSLESIKFYLSSINLKIEVPSEELWQFFVKKGFLIIFGKRKMLIPTVAGLLLFGKNPETFLVQTKIKADYFRGVEPAETIDHLDIKGTLPKVIDETTKFFLRNMKSAMRIEGFSRVEITEYPTEALSVLDPSNVNQWWRNREDFQWVVFEYLKLANFYITFNGGGNN